MEIYIAKLTALLQEAVDDFNVGLPVGLGWVARVERLLEEIENAGNAREK